MRCRAQDYIAKWTDRVRNAPQTDQVKMVRTGDILFHARGRCKDSPDPSHFVDLTRFTLTLPAQTILNEVAKLRKVLPVLKSVGEHFEDTHWAELFTMIKLDPKKVKKDTLKLHHLLERADKLAAEADAVKNLAARAQGEAKIKIALDELKVWGNTKNFSLMGQDASGQGRGVNIIKEWKARFSPDAPTPPRACPR